MKNRSRNIALIISPVLILSIIVLYFGNIGPTFYSFRMNIIRAVSRNYKILRPQKYNNGDKPISLGQLAESPNTYFNIALRFRLDSTDGFTNLFQTAEFNEGLRLEFNGSTAAIVVADHGIKEGYRVIILSNSINIGQWYNLEIDALNNGYVQAYLDGLTVADVITPSLSIKLSQVILGYGFNKDRKFLGQIEGITIKKGDLPSAYFTIVNFIPRSLKTCLSIIANIGIFLSMLLCYLLAKNSALLTNVINSFHRFLFKSPIATITTLIILQIFLMYLIPAYRNIIIIYLFLFFIGVNLYTILTPAFFKKSKFDYLFIPINGILLLTIVGSYFIGFSLNIRYLALTLACITILGFLTQFKFNKNNFIAFSCELKANFSDIFIFSSLILTPIILLLLLPVLNTGYATSAYRIGPDMALYAKMAQYLIDGGTWAKANLRANEFLGMLPGEINRYSDATMSWPFMYYFRWGLTAFQATATILTSSKNVYEIAFVSMVIPHLLLSGLILFWLRNRVRLSIFAALIGAIAFSFNANTINLWYEGFYGNSFALCFFVLIIFVILSFKNVNSFSLGTIIQSTILVSVVFAAILLSYGEGLLFLMPPLLIFGLILDFFLKRSLKWTSYFIILGGACIGLLLVLPCNFIDQWIILTIKQLTQEGGNGYAQPLWAFPHEILGIKSIYLMATPDTAGKMLSRSTLDLFFGLILSFFIMYTIVYHIANMIKSKDFGLYVASVLIVALVACFVYYKSPNNNYTYMKAYVFFLPLLFVLFWSSLFSLHKRYLIDICNENIFVIFIFIPIIISGLVYISQYKVESTAIEPYKIALHDEIKTINMENIIMFPFSVHSNLTMYSAILPTPWIIPDSWNRDHWKKRPYFKDYLNHRVYLFVEKNSIDSSESINNDVIFQNQYFIIIDTGKNVKEAIEAKSGSIDFEIYTKSLEESLSKKM